MSFNPNKFNPIKCVLLDKYIMKDINKFLDPRQRYPKVEIERQKVINEINEFWNVEIEGPDYWEKLRSIEKCELCGTPLMVEINKVTNTFINQFVCDIQIDYFIAGEPFWFCKWCDENNPDRVSAILDNYMNSF